MTPDLSAWGAVTDLRPMTGGARRSAWRGRMGDTAVIAKSGALPEPSLRWQIRVEALARRAGFDTPGLIPTAHGVLSSKGWTLEPFLDGTAAHPRDISAGRLARFHAACRNLPPRPCAPRRRLPGRWDRLVATGGPVGLIHGDLHPGNLLRRPSGRIALLDWEEARIGPRLLDRGAVDSRRPGAGLLHLQSELAACATAEPARARRMALALLARNWP